MKKIITISLFCMAGLITHAQTIVNKEWTRIAGVPDPLSVTTSCIDFQNNVITASSAIVAGQDADISVIKYDQAGSILWQNSFNGVSNGKDYATSIKTDNSGNIYVTGATFNNTSNFDYVILKYDNGGTLQWQLIFNGTGNNLDIPSALVLDNVGDIYVTGGSVGVGTLTDYATIKISNSGNLLWQSTYDYAQGYEAPVGIEIHPGNNKIYVTGASASTPASTNWDFATIDYDASNGNQLNVNRIVSTGNGIDRPSAICRDNSGNIYVTGSYFNQTNNSNDIKTLKLNSNLVVQWTMTFNGDNLDDQANSIDVDATGNVFVAGTVKRSATGNDIIVMKYSPTGTLLWEREINSAGVLGDDEGNQIVVDGNGNAFVCGSIEENGNKNFISMKIDPNGTTNWQDIIDGGANGTDEATSVNVTSQGDIIVSGQTNDGTNDRNTTIRYENIKVDKTNLGTLNNGLQYIKNEIIIKFEPSIINPTFSENIDLKFAPIQDVLPQQLVNEIKTLLEIENENELVLVKIHSWMTPSDNISTARNGKQFIMDKLWSTYRLLLPNTIDEQVASNLLSVANSNIYFADLNYILINQSIPNDPYCQSNQMSLVPSALFPNANIKANEAWDIETGKSFVRVGVLDKLIDYTHPEFGDGTFNGSKIIAGEEIATGLPLSSFSTFSGYHGTCVAGIIGARRNDQIGIAGIAGGDLQNGNNGASIISIGTDDDVATVSASLAKGSSITYSGGWGYYCDVINMSMALFAEQTPPALQEAIKLCFDNHCALVVSRGNRKQDWPTTSNTATALPACYNPDWIINVGGSGNDGKHKLVSVNGDGNYESMYDKNVDVIAPGSGDITISSKSSSIQTNPPINVSAFADNSYMPFSGTSSAAPHVTGLIALMFSHVNGNPIYPNFLDDGDVQHLIKKYANDIGNEGSTIVGSGLIDAKNTLEHIDLNHGYWVQHSNSGQSSCTGQLTTISTNQIVNYAPIYNVNLPLPLGNYIADLIENKYTCTIPLPSFANNPQIIDKWVSHNTGVTMGNTLKGTYFASISSQISGSNIVAVFTTYTWNIHHNISGQAINPVMFPEATNTLNHDFSLLMYDPSIVTSTSNTILNKGAVSVYPNPANDVINIKLENKNYRELNIKIYDILGNVVNEIKNSNSDLIQFSTINLINGIYNIVINQKDKKIATSNFVVSH